MKIILLLLSLCLGGCSNKTELINQNDSYCIWTNADEPIWDEPYLTKEELKALDLKLRQEAITFHEGDRCVNWFEDENFGQTALVLKVDRNNVAIIQYEKTGINEAIGTSHLIKIGDDPIEEPPPSALFWFKYNLSDSCEIDSVKICFLLRNP